MKHDCQLDVLLKDAGLRCTTDRHDLLFLFLEKRAWSASQIAYVYPKKDLSTIYRNLQKMQNVGLIHSLHTHTQEEYFEQMHSEHHDHRVCPSCKILHCIPCPISTITDQHTLEIQQSCHTCV